MKRWLGIADDPTAGGTTLDDLDSDDIAAPSLWLPVTTAQVDPGTDDKDRNNEVRGRRGNTKPISFAAAPSLSFEARAYAKLVRPLVRKAFSGAITGVAGVAPASVSSTVGPLDSGNLQAIIAWLRREDELDRLTGAVLNELELNFPIDEEGTISVVAPALYHDADDADAAEDPNGDPANAAGNPAYTGYDYTFMLRDAVMFEGVGAVEIPNFAGFGFSFSNSLIDDFRSRFQPNHNIEVVEIDGDEHRLWYPARHKLGAQVVTLRIDLSDVDVDRETKRKFRHADKFVFEVAAGPLGTTPEADEMMRLTFYNAGPTGGGPEPITREGDQVSSYEYTAYVSDADAGKDVSATFVGTAALV